LSQEVRVGEEPFSVAVGDFNGDQVEDLVVANSYSNDLSILLGKGDGTFEPAQTLEVGMGTVPWSVVADDFNGDGIADLAVAYSDANMVAIRVGNGDGTFQAVLNFGVQRKPWHLAVGDFNGDKLLDLAVANYNSDTVSILINQTLQP
jgi:hypothetical protein